MLNCSNNNPMIVVNGHASSSTADILCIYRFLGIETEISIRNAEVGARLDGQQRRARNLIIRRRACLRRDRVDRLDSSKMEVLETPLHFRQIVN